MMKVSCIYTVLIPVFLLVSPLPGQISKKKAKLLDGERKLTIKDLKKAIREKRPDDTLHQMRVLRRFVYDYKSKKDVAKCIIKVLVGKFPSDLPKTTALTHLKELGIAGIQELERALLSKLRNQPTPIRLRAIATLAEARHPSSWNILIRLSKDKNQLIALAAVKTLATWKNLPPKKLKSMVDKICSAMRPPTKEELEKDLDLPALQNALRSVLTEITGIKCHTIKDWKKCLSKWKKSGCPACKRKKVAKRCGIKGKVNFGTNNANGLPKRKNNMDEGKTIK